MTLGQYVAAWKMLLTLPPEREIKDWSWFPVTVADVLRDIRCGVRDRINTRGGLKS